MIIFSGAGTIADGELDPTTIATCTEWVSADQPQWAGFSDGQAIGDATHRWEDRLSEGLRYWEQSTAGSRPTFHDTGGPNDKPYVTFDSDDGLGFSNTSSTIVDSDGWTMLMVVSPAQNGTTDGNEFGRNIYTQNGYLGVTLFDDGGNNKFRVYRYNSGYVGVNSQTTYVLNTWYLVVIWYDGTDMWIQVNDDTPQSVTVNGYASDANAPAIYGQFRYTERQTFDSNISATDRNALRASLGTKYTIPF